MSRPKDEFPDLREAMDVWREDAARSGARFDVNDDLVDKILADGHLAAESRQQVGAPAAARAYAAAALIVIGLGIVGTVLTQQARPDQPAAPRWAMLEEELIDVLTQDPRYEPGLGR